MRLIYSPATQWLLLLTWWCISLLLFLLFNLINIYIFQQKTQLFLYLFSRWTLESVFQFLTKILIGKVFHLKVNFGKRDVLMLLNLPFPGYGISYQFFLSSLGLYVNSDNYFFYIDLKAYFAVKQKVFWFYCYWECTTPLPTYISWIYSLMFFVYMCVKHFYLDTWFFFLIHLVFFFIHLINLKLYHRNLIVLSQS